MADTQEIPASTPQQPIAVTIVGGAPLPGAPVFPTPNMDKTVEGGAYIVNGQWVNAEGQPIKAPK